MLIFLRRFNGQYNDVQVREGVTYTAGLMPEVDTERLFTDIKQLTEEHPSLFVRERKAPFATAYGKIVPA